MLSVININDPTIWLRKKRVSPRFDINILNDLLVHNL